MQTIIEITRGKVVQVVQVYTKGGRKLSLALKIMDDNVKI